MRLRDEPGPIAVSSFNPNHSSKVVSVGYAVKTAFFGSYCSPLSTRQEIRANLLAKATTATLGFFFVECSLPKAKVGRWNFYSDTGRLVPHGTGVVDGIDSRAWKYLGCVLCHPCHRAWGQAKVSAVVSSMLKVCGLNDHRG